MGTGSIPFVEFSLMLILTLHCSASNYRVHIAYLGHNHVCEGPLSTTEYYLQMLTSMFDSVEEARDAMIYSYKHSFSGFAAKMNSTQAITLSSLEGVISVYRSRLLNLHTTRSWDFMGLKTDLQAKIPVIVDDHSDVVVGIFDTGIWPESESFQEPSNMKPVPSHWKGECVAGEEFFQTACNKKLIGARFYLEGFESQSGPLNTSKYSEYRSPRDRVGHGTHTASTAVGVPIANASFLGLAPGMARGGAPMARLAVYKVCWNTGNGAASCDEADILAAFDEAIRDGVHVISASFGVPVPLPGFFESSTDIGSFHAAQKGVVVVFSAGNDGPEQTLVKNVAPWSLCVGATTIDRRFPTRLILGNNETIVGEGLVTEEMKLPLVDGAAASRFGACVGLRSRILDGKAVLCFSTTGVPVSVVDAAKAVYAAGGSALVYADVPTRQQPDPSVLPITYVDISQGTKILAYIQRSKEPVVQIERSRTSLGSKPAPTVAYFSSRGPSSISPNILKPDIGAPGVNILASWPPNLPPSSISADPTRVRWNFLSGTSMSCPHVAGVAALLKSANPTWTPAEIKSALMTTARNTDTSEEKILAVGLGKGADHFDIGAGHVDPVAAFDPGLVYDVQTSDYISFLCSLGYNDQQIRRILPIPAGTNVSCPHPLLGAHTDLNYPSIVVTNLRTTFTVRRTLRNVGSANAIYSASFVSPEGVGVAVRPRMMHFTRHREKFTYYVTLTPLKSSRGRFYFGEIVWFDGWCHRVRTPLAVCVNTEGAASSANLSSM